MDVHIDEMSTTVRVVDSQSVLSPAVLAQIVKAVIAAIDAREGTERIRHSETRIRSVVEQQEERRSGG